jgi:hypothetical protein
MAKKPPPSGGQSIFPETPSTPAKLQYSKRKIFWPAIFLLNLFLLFLWLIGRAVFWVWRNKWVAAEWVGVLFWRGVTLVGLIWLIYDRVYEADATLSAPDLGLKIHISLEMQKLRLGRGLDVVPKYAVRISI